MKYLPLEHKTFYTLLVLGKPLETDEIINKVKEASNDLVRLAPGTMHGILTKMEKKGFIYKMKSSPINEKNSYALSHFGSEILELEINRLKDLVTNRVKKVKSSESQL
ncbi:PadR family transcriptional regulator [Priestia megaterium]